ncbi:hypothetical protein FRB94_006373 [Tulasnella sp. JGI-2019a]|nr:hypothetical protein FRB93_001892 [Tulasnella sp. JGI-2019a]KAG8999239.1 hypothetical protein FRB94_006373 [Tulasnella sp. JGI-2019a]KAG9026726.1 hypothetical protein FRB95_008532 [Tulasnella sp. JGI-2019a]
MPAARTEKIITTAKASKNASKKGDGTKPPKEKKPPSAYNLFVKEQMPIWKAANRDAPPKDAMKAIGEMQASITVLSVAQH